MNRHIASIICALVLCMCEMIHCQETVSTPTRMNQEQIQKLILESRHTIQAILSKEIHLPAIAITLVSRDDIVWTEAFGYRDALRKEKVDTSTIFSLQSISKTISATGLMIAVQEGLINLDVPINTYLPNFEVHSRFPERPGESITLRHLLGMTSGLTHDAPVGNNADPFTPSYQDHIRSISDTWLRFKPGTRAEYSNLGIELAAQILENVTHRSFTEYIRERVFEPLGMTRTTYDIARIRRDENRAIGHNKIIASVPLEIPMLAPGGVYASIADMARFLRFQVNECTIGGRAILKNQIVRQMRAIPFPMKDQIAGYCQGLWVGYYHLTGQDVCWFAHGGGGFGFRCQMKWLPDLGYGVMVMTNSQDHDNVNENLVEEILLKIIEVLMNRKDRGPSDWLVRHMPSRSVDSSYLPTGLEGRYNGTNDDMVFLIKDGRFGYASGNAFVPVMPFSRNEYISSNYVYRFVRDSAGKPVSVVRPYDGTVWLLGSPGDEPRGPDKQEWKNYTGTYIRKRFGVSERFYVVSIRNGWLHFEGSGQDFRLAEHLPGLFFTPDGEAIDLRNSKATFRNIKLYKTCD